MWLTSTSSPRCEDAVSCRWNPCRTPCGLCPTRRKRRMSGLAAKGGSDIYLFSKIWGRAYPRYFNPYIMITNGINSFRYVGQLDILVLWEARMIPFCGFRSILKSGSYYAVQNSIRPIPNPSRAMGLKRPGIVLRVLRWAIDLFLSILINTQCFRTRNIYLVRFAKHIDGVYAIENVHYRHGMALRTLIISLSVSTMSSLW